MNVVALAVVLALASSSTCAAVIEWVQITEPAETIKWSQIEDPVFLDEACRGDNTLPRVCLYRHNRTCRIITPVPKDKLDPRVREELLRMCGGFFPEPVLLRRKFSDPNYNPNQSPPSVDPVWRYQQEHPQ